MAELSNPNASRNRSVKRWAGAAGCIGAAAVVAAHAASAAFQGGAAVSQGATTAGDLYLTVPGSGSTNRMTLTVDNLFAANIDFSTPWRERVVNVTNAGNLPLATFSIATIASTSNHLSADVGGGVMLIVDECSGNWTEGGTAAEPTYTCPGGSSQADVLGCAACGTNSAPVDYDMTPNNTSTYTWTTAGSPALGNIGLTAGAVNHLRIRFKLSWSASAAAEGQSENVTFTFDGTARAGTNA